MLLFRLKYSDFESERREISDQAELANSFPPVTLNDLTPEEWIIVKMVRESAGSHGCVLPGESPLARLCSAPKPRPAKDAFTASPGTQPARRPVK